MGRAGPDGYADHFDVDGRISDFAHAYVLT